MYKKVFVLILILVLVVLVGCTLENNKTSIDETEYIKEKSISVSLATYTGTKDILIKNSNNESRKYLLDTMERNIANDTIVQKVDINSIERNGNIITVIVKIEEEPFKSILFHEYKYELVDGKWIIVEFGVGA